MASPAKVATGFVNAGPFWLLVSLENTPPLPWPKSFANAQILPTADRFHRAVDLRIPPESEGADDCDGIKRKAIGRTYRIANPLGS